MNGNWRKSMHSLEAACVEVAAWRKSSFSDTLSGTGTQECVEVASWRKSSFSDTGCISAGTGEGIVGVRDTQLRQASPVLKFSPAAWRNFANNLK